MTIREAQATVYLTEDGVQHATIEDAREHQFTQAIAKWAEATCYSGMDSDDVVSAVLENRVRLAAIFREYVK